MTALVFAVHDRSDPLGAPVGTLTEASAKRLLVEADGVGAGGFTLNRHSAQAAWCERGAYVTAYYDTVGTIDDAIGAFWLEEAGTDLLDLSEQGGEDIGFGGRGPISLLSEALVWHRSKRSGRKARRAVQPSRRRWHWARAHPSRALVRLLEEAVARGSLLGPTSRDFTRAHDSDNDAWAESEAQRLNVPIGINMLELVDMLRDTGLYVEMGPDLVLHAWDSHGTDRSADVLFTAGVNISEGAERQWAESRARSAILVEGENNRGKPRYRAFRLADIEAKIGRRKEGYYRHERTSTRKVLRRVGRKRLRRWEREYDQPIAFGVLIEEDAVPFVDYWPGDTITLDIPGEYDEAPIRVASVTLSDMSSGEVAAAIELGAYLSARHPT